MAILSNTNIVSGSADRTIKIWQSKSPYKCIATITGHSVSVEALVILPNSNIVSGSNSLDGSIKIWQSEPPFKRIATLYGQIDGVVALAIFPNSSNIISGCGGFDSTIQIFQTESPYSRIATLYGHDNGVKALAILPNSNIFSGSYDYTIKIWQFNKIDSNNIEISKSLKTFYTSNYQNSEITTLAFFNSIFLVVGFADSTIKYWNILYMSQYPNLNGHNQAITCLFNLNDQFLFSGSSDRKIVVYDSNLAKFDELTVHKGRINSIVYLFLFQ